MTAADTVRSGTTAAEAARPAGRTVVGSALVALAGLSFGVMPILAKKAYADGATPLGLLSVRFTVAGLLLLALARWQRQRLPRGRVLLALLALGGIGYAGEALCYFVALEHASAGIVALLLYVYPGFVVVLSSVLQHRMPGGVTIGCLAVALVGTALAVSPSGGADHIGVVLALGSAALYGCYIVLSDRAIVDVGAIAAAGVVMCGAAVTSDALAGVLRPDYPTGAAGWAGMLGVALVCTVVAVTAFFAGLARVGPARAAVISTVEPVVGVTLGAAVLGEAFGPAQAVGGALVLAAVVVLATRRSP